MLQEQSRISRTPNLAGPLYLQVYELMKRRVKANEWRAGQSLPNEGELARDFGVSVGTMRKAMEALEGAGWVVRYQGRGTFITDIAANQVSRFSRLYAGPENLSGASFKYISKDTGKANAQEAEKLRIAEGDEVVRLTALRSIKNKAMIVDKIVVADEMLPGIADRSLGSLSGHPFAIYFENFGVTVTGCTESLVAQVADAEMARLLNCEAGAPILASDEIAVEERKLPVHWCQRYAHLIDACYFAELG